MHLQGVVNEIMCNWRNNKLSFLKINNDEIRKNEREWWTIYKAKMHDKRSDAYDWKRGQSTSATCHLTFKLKDAYTI